MSEETTAAGTGEQEAYEPDPRRWRILGVTLVIGFMALLDVTIVNVAVPSMRAGLDTSASTIQWVVSGYSLAFGLVLVTGGRLGDAYGRRRMMLMGLVGFVAASAAVGLAPTAAWVIGARLVQGAAAGFLTPQNSGLIQQLFRGAERGRAFGFFGLTVSISSGLGPVIGGLIISLAGEQDGWRYLFLVNVPIGLVAMVFVARMVPQRPREEADHTRLDHLGAALLGAAVLCLLFPLVSVESGARLPLVLLVGTPVFLWGFVRWERRVARRGGAPLLDVALLRRTPGYANGLAVGALYFTGFTGIFLVLSVYLQEGMSFSPLAAGLLLTPFAVGSAAHRPAGGPAGVADPSPDHRHRAQRDDGRRARGGAPGAGPRRRGALAGAGAAAAGRRPRGRRRGLAELHPQPRRGAAPDGRGRRRRAADRPADRLLDRGGAADDRLRPRAVVLPRPGAAGRAAHVTGRARRRHGDGGAVAAPGASLTLTSRNFAR